MGDSGQGSGKDGVLPQRHLAFLPMPPGSVIPKRLVAKVMWALLEQKNPPKLCLHLSLLPSSLGALKGPLWGDKESKA